MLHFVHVAGKLFIVLGSLWVFGMIVEHILFDI